MCQKISQSDEINNNKCTIMHNEMQSSYYYALSDWLSYCHIIISLI